MIGKHTTGHSASDKERMMPSRMIKDKSKYVLSALIGNSTGIVRDIKTRFWTWKVSHMTDGQILDLYYELIDKKEEGDM